MLVLVWVVLFPPQVSLEGTRHQGGLISKFFLGTWGSEPVLWRERKLQDHGLSAVSGLVREYLGRFGACSDIWSALSHWDVCGTPRAPASGTGKFRGDSWFLWWLLIRVALHTGKNAAYLLLSETPFCGAGNEHFINIFFNL